MPWLTQLLGSSLYGPTGVQLGRVRDLVAVRGKFPRVIAISARLNSAGREILSCEQSQAFLTWESARQTGRSLTLGVLRPAQPPAGAVSLRANVLDRQIIDTEGARVVRVNDLLLSESAAGPTVVAADVGLKGALRGLGIEGPAGRIAKALGYEIPSKLIAWNFVEPLGDDPTQVRLNVPSRLLKELHPSELADILEQLDPQLRQTTLDMMSVAGLAETLPETEPELSREAFGLMSEERARRVVELMAPDEAADLLALLGYATSERLLELMGVRQAAVLRELLGHPPESAGGRMTPSFLALPDGATVQEAIETIRSRAAQAEVIYYLYVVDAGSHLLGVVSLRALITASPQTPVSVLMERDVVTVKVTEDQQEVARKMARYDLLAVPVLDDDEVLKGIVTVDDMVDVIEQGASQDLSEVTGIYLGEGPGAATGRLAGFGVSIVAGAAAAILLNRQAALLGSVAAAAWLLPLFLRVAQDLGTWSLARGFAAAGLRPEVRLEMLGQELLAALAAAGLSGLAVLAFGTLWLQSGKAAVLAVAIFIAGLAASVFGFGLPAAAGSKRFRKALGSSRVFAMAAAVMSLIIYVWALAALVNRT